MPFDASLDSEPIPEVIDYNFHVRPILSDNCFVCHGPDAKKQKANLRLDIADHAYAPLEAHPELVAIAPGDLKKSHAYQRIISDDPAIVMPPPDAHLTLSKREKAIIAQWITDGAKYDDFWAFKTVPEKSIPPVASQFKGNVINEVDHFVLNKLAVKGLTPAPPAGLEKYIRRVAFAVTGLPPTIEQLDTFLANGSDKHIHEQVIDYYLKQSAYGERMATEWLDVARFADTIGYQVDTALDMSPWRDWVIGAFNDNMSHDQFIVEQLAGDLLANATQQQILATAFNRLNKMSVEGGVIDEEFRTEYVIDRTNTFGTAFLGMTIECARCHDHKYDPVSQKEFYQLFSFFNNIDEAGIGQWDFIKKKNHVGPSLLLSTDKQAAQLDEMQDGIASHQQLLVKAQKASDLSFNAWRKQHDSLPLSVIPLFPQTFSLKHLSKHSPPAQRKARAFFFEGDNTKKITPPVDDKADKEKQALLKDAFAFDSYDSFSLVYWLYIPETLKHGVILHNSGHPTFTGRQGYEMSVKDGKLTAALYHMWPLDGVVIDGVSQLPHNQWVQVAMTYDGTMKAKGLKLYVNSVPEKVIVKKDTLSKSIRNSFGGIKLGGRTHDVGLKNGYIGDLHVFNQLLALPELNALYQGEDQINVTAFADKGLNVLYKKKYDNSFKHAKELLTKAVKPYIDLRSSIQPIMVMREMPIPRKAFVLGRGEYTNPTEEVFASTPSVMPPFDKQWPKNRLGLAKWITSRNHPLTSRVIVNRYWQMVFGVGLVDTPQDFGNQGSLPTHPKLLDYLAADFMDSGWDLKRLLKKMLLSATFRQSTVNQLAQKKDPKNRYLARGTKNKLTAEMVRDTVLANSGLLVNRVGGKSVKPYLPEDSWAGSDYAVRHGGYKPGKGDDLYRRSLYTFWKRTAPPVNMLLFNANERNVCAVQRRPATTPLQALVLLNDEQFTEAYRKLAENVVRNYPDAIERRLNHLFRVITSRLPEQNELALIKDLYLTQLEMFKEAPREAGLYCKIGQSSVDDQLDKGDVAATAMVVTVVMNFDESIFGY